MQIFLTQAAFDKSITPISPKNAVHAAFIEAAGGSPVSLTTTAIATVAMLASTLIHAQSISFETLSSSTNPPTINVVELISRPTLPIEFIKNIKYIFDHDLLLQNSFYDEKNLKNIFNLSKVSISENEGDPWMSSGDFAGIFPRLMAEGAVGAAYASANITAGKYFSNQTAPDLANLHFRLSRGGPSFQSTISIFGNKFTRQDFTPIFHHQLTSPTSAYSNKNWNYSVSNGKITKTITLAFNSNGELSDIVVFYPRIN